MAEVPGGQVGRRLLPVIIDDVARDDPERAWASLPIDDYDLEQGFEDITYAQFANAINKLAHCIVKAFGRSTTFETIAYYGVPDIRYFLLSLAAIKTGHKALFSSPTNPLKIHLSMIDYSNCHAMLFARGVYVNDVLAQRPMATAEIPELDDLLDLDDLAEPFPYAKSYAEAENDCFSVCHTSGTTGDPRPVSYTHASMASMDQHSELEDVDGRGHWIWQAAPGERYLMVASSFHPISVVLAMVVSVFGGGILLPGFRHRGVTEISEMCDIIKYGQPTTGFMPSFLMDTIARRPDADDYIKGFETITYGSGILSEYAAKIYSDYGIPFQNIWGTCETLSPPILKAEKEDYAYVHFDVDAAGLIFREKEDLEYFDDDGSRLSLYEMVMTLTPESVKCVGYWAGLGITEAPSSPPYPEYATGEVWTPHPDPKKAKFAWRFISRIPDLITQANAFSFVFERALGQNKKVQNTIILKKYEGKPIALIELAEGVLPEEAGDVWEDSIEPGNEDVPEEARIDESHVILVKHGEFIRGTEGHISRRQVEKKYADHIDEIYGRGSRKVVVVERPRYESIIQTVDIVEVIEDT